MSKRPAGRDDSGRWLVSPFGLYCLGRPMLRRILSVVLLSLLCLPATSLAVLYTCAMDGLTRMSNCDEHAEHRVAATADAVEHGAGHGCGQPAAAPATCCDIHVVTASLETPPIRRVEVPSGSGVYVVSLEMSRLASRGFTGPVDAPPWRGPPLYVRLASYLI